MSEENHGVPTKSGSGGLVALGIIMLLAAGGLVVWKLQSGGEVEQQDEVVEAPAPAPKPAQEAPVLDNAPPPPPTEEEVEEEDEEEEQKKVVSNKPRGPSGCSGACTGEATASFKSALATRAGMARTCYNTALRRNSTLQGKMTVSVRVSPTGQVCSASVSNNTSGDAALAACVGAKFRSAQFPAPTGGCVDAAVPLNFTPKQ